MPYQKKTKGKGKGKSTSPTFTSWKKNTSKKPYKKKVFIPTIPTKHDCWLDGTFAVDPLTWEMEHIKNCQCPPKRGEIKPFQPLPKNF